MEIRRRIGRLFGGRRGQRGLPPQQEVAGTEQRGPRFVKRSYQVSGAAHGITVREQPTGVEFFRTSAGGWFWLADSSPFDEDATVGPELSEYLDKIVETSRQGR